nr:sigma-54-dependent Fis family transcriptional regulator [candidate division Zixibacteria bacterium]
MAGLSVCDKPGIPPCQTAEATAYIDLEKEEFRQESFYEELSESFDKLKIIGIADSISDDQTLRLARMGVSEILSHQQYRDHLESLLKKEETSPAVSTVVANKYDISAIIGHSPRIMATKEMIDNLRDVDYPNAIIFGETGTGKDLLAKVMHYSGIRRNNHFIEVNCSAIPDELFESELFGHKKGAFTDARNDKKGLFEFADNGTIFLDEIGNLTPSAQAKLLKILESRKLRPLGTVRETEINVRVLAATNIDLERAVGDGRFREDLLFRLNLIAIHLPPLRERKEDIPDLAKNNFEFYRSLYNKKTLVLEKGAIDKLVEHHWPGNVRELRNVIERSVLLTLSPKIGARQIGEAIINGRITARERKFIRVEIPETGLALKSIEKQIVGEILNMVSWNRSEAARILHISRARLRRIMEENKLQKDRRH